MIIKPHKLYLRAHMQPCWSWTDRRSIQLKQFFQIMEGIIHGKARRINTYLITDFLNDFVPLNLLKL
jgi:hypothetical protein